MDSPDKMCSDLIFFLNGEKIIERNPDPTMTLLQYIRSKRRLTGTKLGCGEGGCGACTVMCSSFDGHSHVNHCAINACLAPLVSVHGMAVTTVEGIGNIRSKLHPVQRVIAESHGSQCGFCTPGIVMATYALLRRANGRPSKQQLYQALDGNLCRCTGYRSILEGLYPFTRPGPCAKGDNCCLNSTRDEPPPSKAPCVEYCQEPINSDSGSCCGGNSLCVKPRSDCHEENDLVTTCGVPGDTERLYDVTQEPIFPPELKISHNDFHSHCLKFEMDNVTWYRPIRLQEVLHLKKVFPDCRLVGGNTEIGIETKFKGQRVNVMVSTGMVKELTQMEVTNDGLRIGASVTLTRVEERLTHCMETLPAWKTRTFTAFHEMLRWFASTQIRNVASLGGNIMNASPISDLNPLLLACRAEFLIASSDQSYTVPADESFFIGYKKTNLQNNEILVSVLLPFTTETEHVVGFKQANRKEDDISIVNAGMYVKLGQGDLVNQHVVQDLRLVFGGMGKTTVMAHRTRKSLLGRPWDASLLQLACSDPCLPSDLPLPAGAPGGMVAYRRTLCLSFFLRFFDNVTREITQKESMDGSVPDGATGLVRGESKGSHLYSLAKSTSQYDSIGKPLVHTAAYKQCTGEATYMDDLPTVDGELHMALVTSPKAHAIIVSIDASVAREMSGVVDVVDYRDAPNSNEWDATEQVFAKGKVVHEGQVVAGILATSASQARMAAKAVTVVYKDLESVVTIQDAIRAKAIHPTSLALRDGDIDEAFVQADQVETGEMHVNAQEHFYLEPHGCVVYPRDGEELEVVTTTQSPTHMQKALSHVLGKPANLIKVTVKRLGGGFGGKETRNASILLPTAVAAIKTNRPVRCVLDRDEDMCLTGTRHPAYVTYKIGFNKDGKILALDADLYLNMGCTVDLSPAVLETAILQSDNAYKIDNFHIRGHLCQTNVTSCTAFRGFGGPQTTIMAENWVGHVAHSLGLPGEVVRQRNFYKDGDRVPCGQTLRLCNLARCWDECLANSHFDERRKRIEEFNRCHQWRKRGIAMTPLKYGLAFLQQSMNQGAALVNIYTDGTVWVTHGGVEMGQGLHTKMTQVVSRELDISASTVHISETSTAFIPNGGPTAASMSSDLYGAAIIDACTKLAARLEPYRKANPHGSMKDWADSAHRNQVPLSACGFYKLDDLTLDWTQKVNEPFSYFSFGVACTEVELDCLTGDHQVIKTDIVMDVGHSLNPAIDVGQIEGAFIQGYGMYVLEDYKVNAQGVHLSRGPGTYKIPSFANIPQEFNVSLLKDSENPRALYSSKGIGEPPLCLAVSAFMALKDAVSAVRTQHGYPGHFRLDSPCTPDKLRMACRDDISVKFLPNEKEDEEKPWSVKL